MACAAAPAVTPASERILEFSGDVTDKLQAVVLPRIQLEMRIINIYSVLIITHYHYCLSQIIREFMNLFFH